MKFRHISLFIIFSLFLIACNNKTLKNSNLVDDQKIDWIHQVDSLLMPYWTQEVALGDPIGNFPNYRFNNGNIVNPEEFDFSTVPSFLSSFIIEQTDSLRRDFLRIKSRQTFAYGVAFHLTGNEMYLNLAKTGVDYLIKNGEYESGAPITFWQNNTGNPKISQRNSQDLAYSLTGLAMYYYLTRDESILARILTVKDYIFATYFDQSVLSEQTTLFMWVKENFESDNTTSKQLVAALDQLNAYLLLLAPIVPDELGSSFKDDIRKTCYAIKNNFYSERYNVFWGDLNDKTLGQVQTDFGHSIKTFWMCYLAGKLIEDQKLTEFARTNALKLLQTAYIEETGSWAQKFSDSTLVLDKGKIWWAYAELDQMAATLSFQDTSLYSKYLIQTYEFWSDNLIDVEHKEVWFGTDELGEVIFNTLPKAIHWKNGYHSLEHALIGYLSTSKFYNEKTELYFAFKKGKKPEVHKIRPYYYDGNIEKLSENSFKNALLNDLQLTKVHFKNIK